MTKINQTNPLNEFLMLESIVRNNLKDPQNYDHNAFASSAHQIELPVLEEFTHNNHINLLAKKICDQIKVDNEKLNKTIRIRGSIYAVKVLILSAVYSKLDNYGTPSNELSKFPIMVACQRGLKIFSYISCLNYLDYIIKGFGCMLIDRQNDDVAKWRSVATQNVKSNQARIINHLVEIKKASQNSASSSKNNMTLDLSLIPVETPRLPERKVIFENEIEFRDALLDVASIIIAFARVVFIESSFKVKACLLSGAL